MKIFSKNVLFSQFIHCLLILSHWSENENIFIWTKKAEVKSTSSHFHWNHFFFYKLTALYF